MNEYWIVTEKSTGRVIAHCGDVNDAMMMVSFAPHNRIYRKQKLIMDQVIDVNSTTDKQLSGQIGLPSVQEFVLADEKIKLKESEWTTVDL